MYKSNVVSMWRKISKGNYIFGSKCSKCNNLFFPSKRFCTKCRSNNLEDYKFRGTGEVYSYSEIHYPPSGFEKYVPYIIAIIKLDEGPKITAQIVDVEKVEIGMRVESCIRKIYVDGDSGLIHYGIKFRPMD